MGYNYGQIFAAELLGTAAIVFFGDGSVANAILPGTKGHGLGFMGIAFGFGWGVFVAIQCFAHISGNFNPGVALGAAVIGDLPWKTTLVCWAGEIVGAFIGGLLVWITYFQHFQPLEVVEEGDGKGGEDGAHKSVVRRKVKGSSKAFASAGPKRRKAKTALKVEVKESEDSPGGLLRRLTSITPNATSAEAAARETVELEDIKDEKAVDADDEATVDDAVREDQVMKLVVFCTRPAIFDKYWIFALWAEILGTFLLTFAAMSMNHAGLSIANGPLRHLYDLGLTPFYKGMLFFSLVLSIGGLTGPALNPARDLMPRIVHWLVPIPGKGSSEWFYSWVPVVGPLIGGVLGALMADQMRKIVLTGRW